MLFVIVGWLEYHVGTGILTVGSNTTLVIVLMVGSDTTPDMNTNTGWPEYHVSTLTIVYVWFL